MATKKPAAKSKPDFLAAMFKKSQDDKGGKPAAKTHSKSVAKKKK